jgi:hypothetical protein
VRDLYYVGTAWNIDALARVILAHPAGSWDFSRCGTSSWPLWA